MTTLSTSLAASSSTTRRVAPSSAARASTRAARSAYVTEARAREQGDVARSPAEQRVGGGPAADLLDGHGASVGGEGQHPAGDAQADGCARLRDLAGGDTRDDHGVAVTDPRAEGGVVTEVADVEDVGDDPVGGAR